MVGAQGHGEPGEVEQFLSRSKECGDGFGVGHAEHRCPTFWARGDKAAVLQAGKVLGYRRLGQAEVFGQFNNLVVTQQQGLEDHQSGAVAEPVEQARSGGQRRVGLMIYRVGCHRYMAMIGREPAEEQAR